MSFDKTRLNAVYCEILDEQKAANKPYKEWYSSVPAIGTISDENHFFKKKKITKRNKQTNKIGHVNR